MLQQRLAGFGWLYIRRHTRRQLQEAEVAYGMKSEVGCSVVVDVFIGNAIMH
jgi:hypothetical protein